MTTRTHYLDGEVSCRVHVREPAPLCREPVATDNSAYKFQSVVVAVVPSLFEMLRILQPITSTAPMLMSDT